MFSLKHMDYVDKTRCPICDIKMKNMGEKNVCQECGYSYRLYGTVSGALNKSSVSIEDVNARHNHSENPAEVWSDVHGEYDIKKAAGDMFKRNASKAEKRLKKPLRPMKIMILIIFIYFILSILGTIILSLF